jgi:hypothetical protein
LPASLQFGGALGLLMLLGIAPLLYRTARPQATQDAQDSL